MLKLIVLAVAIASCNAFPRASNTKLRGIDLRIVDGDVTTIEQHPWQVSFREDGTHFCSGSLISKNTVLTTASCAEGLEIGKHKIVVGTDILSSGGDEYDIASFVINDKYDSLESSNDIAVVKIKGAVDIKDTVQIAKLPEQGKPVADGTEVTVTGWGSQFEDELKFSEHLREVQLNIVGKEECEKAYPGELTETMICAAVPTGGKGPCWGDAGSPLTVDDVVYGIVSWGRGCAQRGYPSIYADVAGLRDWIKENSGV